MGTVPISEKTGTVPISLHVQDLTVELGGARVLNEDVIRYLTVRVDKLEEEPSVQMQKKERDERRRRDRERRREDEE